MNLSIVENEAIWTEESTLTDPGSVPRGVRNPLHFTLGKRLKAARTGAALTRKSLEQLASMSNGALSPIEERGRVPGVDVVERLARSLRLSPCALAYGVAVAYVEASDDAPLHCLGIGERLRGARELAGLSMRALGREADLTPTAIGNIESAKVLPGVDVAEALASALKISPCYLAFGEGAAEGPRFPPPIKKNKPAPAPRRARTTATVPKRKPGTRGSRLRSERPAK